MEFGTIYWADLINSFVGAFLGFLFAIFMQKLVDSNQEKKKKETLISNIIYELEKIYNEFAEYVEFDGILVYNTSIWNSVVSSGYILELLQEEPEIYNSCMFIYSKLNGLYELERKTAFNIQDKRKLVIETRKDVINEIEAFFLKECVQKYITQ